MPALKIFETSYRRGKFDESRKLSTGGMLEFANIYPMDAVFDKPEDVPEEVFQGAVKDKVILRQLGRLLDLGWCRSIFLQRQVPCVEFKS